MTTEKSSSSPFLVTATEGSTASSQATAGRELDALIAEKVMDECSHPFDSWTKEGPDGDRQTVCGICRAFPHTPHYSTDIAVAWEVVEKLRESGWCIDIRIDDEPWDTQWLGGYGVSLLGCNRGRIDATDIRATAETLPAAICLAALKSVGA